MYKPYMYDMINLEAGTYSPSTIKSRNNLSYKYWFRALYLRACSSVILTVPEEFTGNIKDFLYYCLFKFGFVAVFDNNTFGFSFQPAKLKGYSFYYQPTDVLVTNPALKKSLELEIGKDCELLRISPDYAGIWDIIDYYASRLSEMDNGINMAIINSKFAWCLGAKNKSAAEAIKKIFDRIQRGEPAVVYKDNIVADTKDKASPFHFLERGALKQSYITSDMLMDLQTILNAFDCEIGIPVLPYQKKERMVTSEAESKIMDATSRMQTLVDTFNEDAKVIYNKYGKTFKAVLRFVPKEGAEEDEQSETNTNRLESMDA